MKKIGAELILGTMLLPWAVWITVAVFNSQKVEAVQETKYQIIIDKLEEIKKQVEEIR